MAQTTEAATTPAAPATSATTPATSLVAPGATFEEFASGLAFAEGPLILSGGRVVVSDVDGDEVLTYSAAGKRRDVRHPSNTANGHALGGDGALLEAQSGDATKRGAIARIAADGSATVLADAFRGKRLNSPNDLIAKRDGTIWFTDPDYGREFTSGIGYNGVYRVDPKTGTVTLVTKELLEPNGIAFSPDEKTLYVTDSAYGLVAFPVKPDDTVGEPHLFVGSGCDGIAVDERGDIWPTPCNQHLVFVTDPAGHQVEQIETPATPTNVAWGGAAGMTLFVTTQTGAVYTVAVTVRETP